MAVCQHTTGGCYWEWRVLLGDVKHIAFNNSEV